eukprot:3491478-Amphidinium_carterae.2
MCARRDVQIKLCAGQTAHKASHAVLTEPNAAKPLSSLYSGSAVPEGPQLRPNLPLMSALPTQCPPRVRLISSSCHASDLEVSPVGRRQAVGVPGPGLHVHALSWR